MKKPFSAKSTRSGSDSLLERLHPWCIIRPFPNMRSKIVGRFRRRVDAEGHLRVLQQMIPTVPFEIMFDVLPEETDVEHLQQNSKIPN